MATRSANGRIFALEIDYTNSAHRAMGAGAANAKVVNDLFLELGYGDADTSPLTTAAPRDIVDAIEEWTVDGPEQSADRRDGEQLVLYLAGHGDIHRRFFVMAEASPASRPWNAKSAISVDDIADHLLDSGARNCVVLLDTCHAGAGALQVADMLGLDSKERRNEGTDIGVLGAALPLDPAYEGRFVRELTDALRNGSNSKHWQSISPDITLYELRDELRDRLDEQIAFTAGNDGIKIPNPACRPGHHETSALFDDILAELSEDDREHFLAKAAGADIGDLGWYFSGRRGASRRLLTWLGRHDEGVYVVTGSPGAGKSAFLGRFAIMADKNSQSACRSLGMFDDANEPRPTAGLFDAVVHARKLDAARIAIDLGDQLGIDVSHATKPAVALRVALVEQDRSITVLVDAVDEVEAGQHDAVTVGIIRALGSLPGCRVIVGSRRDIAGVHLGGVDDPGPLLEAMRPASAPWQVDDLDDDPDTDADIRGYVDSKLLKTDQWPHDDRRATAAKVVAEQADGLFLYARFALKAFEGKNERLLDDPDWASTLPSDAGDAGLHHVFNEDLARYGPDAERIRAELAA